MLAALTLLLPGLLVAPPVQVASTGATCEGAELGDRVDHYLAATDGPRAAVEITADLVQRDALWELELRFGEGSPRQFRALRCETVVDAAAFVIAVAIDPSVAEVIDGPELLDPTAEPEPAEVIPEPEPELEPELEPEPEPAPEPEPEPEPKPPDAVSSGPGSPLSILVAVSGGVDGGSLPGAGGLVRGTVGLGGRGWRVDLGGHYRTPTRATSQRDPGAGGDVSGWALMARGCGVPTLSSAPLSFPLCLGVEGGQVLGAGFGFPGAQATRLPWLAVVAGAGLTWHLRPALGLFVAVEAGVAPLRGQLVIENLETVHEVGVVLGRGLVGVQGRFSVR